MGGFFDFPHSQGLVAFASSVRGSLVVMVIAFRSAFGYTCVAIRKELKGMAQTKNLCAQIPLELHAQVCEAKEKSGQAMIRYITDLLTEYFKLKRNGGTIMANGRTMAFQISEELFQRIKAHLERETLRTGRKLTQREFVLGLLQEALDRAEQEAATAE